MIRLFFSYSHRDEELRNELEVHLSPLKREGIIAPWHDRRIPAGGEFERSISEHLEAADIVLLLVSPYFLDSDYCHEVEMRRALERHELGEACVIPVILQPCDWKSSSFGKLLATPTDGKPITKFSNLHDGFLEVVTQIRQVATELSGSTELPKAERPSRPAFDPALGPRSSNLRVTKEFSDHQRAQFRIDSFEYIANYFENSLSELKHRNPELDHMFRRVDSNTFTASVYSSSKQVSACTIKVGGTLGDVTYSASDTPRDNSCNEWLSIEHDGHTPCLKPGGMPMRPAPESNLTQEGASEYLWSIFIEPLQRRDDEGSTA